MMSHASGLQALDVDDLMLGVIGPKFEHHEMFPSRTNTGMFFLIYRSFFYVVRYYDHRSLIN